MERLPVQLNCISLDKNRIPFEFHQCVSFLPGKFLPILLIFFLLLIRCIIQQMPYSTKWRKRRSEKKIVCVNVRHKRNIKSSFLLHFLLPNNTSTNSQFILFVLSFLLVGVMREFFFSLASPQFKIVCVPEWWCAHFTSFEIKKALILCALLKWNSQQQESYSGSKPRQQQKSNVWCIQRLNICWWYVLCLLSIVDQITAFL